MRLSYSLRREKTLTIVAFLALPVLLFVAFYIYPIVFTFYLSLHDWDGLSPRFQPIGLKNYLASFQATEMHVALLNNAQWLVYYILVPPALGLALALMLNRTIRGGGVFEATIFLPFTITPIAVAAMWRWLYNPGFGFFNTVLKGIGLDFLALNWLGDPGLATYSVMIAATWFVIGSCFVLYLAGLKNVPQDLIDAAKMDGASFPVYFRHVLWPMLRPSTVVVIALQAMRAIKLFDLLYALTGGGPAYYTTVLSVYMYDVAFRRFYLGQGSAIAIVLFVLAAVIISPYLLYSMRKLEEIRQ